MTEYDWNNVRFILSLSPSKCKEWFNTLSQEDIDYAFEIMNQFRDELRVNVTLSSDPDVSSTELANEILKRYSI